MPNSAMDERIAARVTEARDYLELSQEELAEMVGVETVEIAAIEAGDQQISAALLTEIAKALGRGVEFFTANISAEKAAERTEFLARAAETLSDQDMGELQRFAIYLKSRSESAAA